MYDPDKDEELMAKQKVLGDISEFANKGMADQLKAKYSKAPKQPDDIERAPEAMDETPRKPKGVEVKMGAPTFLEKTALDEPGAEPSKSILELNDETLGANPSPNIPVAKMTSGNVDPVDFQKVGDVLLVKFSDGTFSEEPLEKEEFVAHLINKRKNAGNPNTPGVAVK